MVKQEQSRTKEIEIYRNAWHWLKVAGMGGWPVEIDKTVYGCEKYQVNEVIQTVMKNINGKTL